MTVLICGFVLAMVLGVPVAFALGIGGAFSIILHPRFSVDLLPTILFGGMDSFPLLAIPFFIMAGDLLSRTGMMERMIALANALTGPVRGGLGYVNVGSSMLFGGVTGVAIADTAAVGSTLVPAMIRDGYGRGFAAAITASSSVIGSIIPPSVGMLIVAYIFGSLSIGRLFLTGVVPGILVGFALMCVVAVMAPIRKFPRGHSHWSLREISSRFFAAAPGLGVPLVVVGGIVGGYFTASEAGAIAVAYALIVGGIIQRRLKLSDISASLLGAARTSGMVFILLATAKLVAWILVMEQVPQKLSLLVEPYVSSQSTFLIAVVVLFFLLGMVMEGMAAMVMLVPVLATMAPKFGVEPHHLAIVIVMTVQLALITPPVALGLFIIQPFAQCSMSEAAKEVVPFLLTIVAVIVLIVFFPIIAQWLPYRFGFG